MEQFWVIGGEYTDTQFDTLLPGTDEKRVGPFTSYETALKEWQGLSSKHVDNCHMRFRIQPPAPKGKAA